MRVCRPSPPFGIKKSPNSTSGLNLERESLVDHALGGDPAQTKLYHSLPRLLTATSSKSCGNVLHRPCHSDSQTQAERAQPAAIDPSCRSIARAKFVATARSRWTRSRCSRCVNCQNFPRFFGRISRLLQCVSGAKILSRIFVCRGASDLTAEARRRWGGGSHH